MSWAGIAKKMEKDILYGQGGAGQKALGEPHALSADIGAEGSADFLAEELAEIIFTDADNIADTL